MVSCRLTTLCHSKGDSVALLLSPGFRLALPDMCSSSFYIGHAIDYFNNVEYFKFSAETLIAESASNHLPTANESVSSANAVVNSSKEGVSSAKEGAGDASNGANKSENIDIDCTGDFVSPGDTSSLGRKRKSTVLDETVGSDDESTARSRKKMRTDSPVAEDGDVGQGDDDEEEKKKRKRDDASILLRSPVIIDGECGASVPLRRVDSGQWIGHSFLMGFLLMISFLFLSFFKRYLCYMGSLRNLND